MILEYALAYLIGSIPTAYWYAKTFHNLDIRQHGSGNVGATNSLRVLGKKAGIVVLLIDLLKGLIPVILAQKLGLNDFQVLMVGVSAILGHIFSPFVGFSGGKGIATAFGVILAFSPIGALICLVSFLITFFISKYVSLGSILGAIAFSIYAVFQFRDTPKVQILAVGISVLLIFTHRKNIQRLISRTESKIK